jgi:hypothetical protein
MSETTHSVSCRVARIFLNELGAALYALVMIIVRRTTIG